MVTASNNVPVVARDMPLPFMTLYDPVAWELSPQTGRIIYSIVLQLHLAITISMLILRLYPANEGRLYFVTPPLNGWMQT